MGWPMLAPKYRIPMSADDSAFESAAIVLRTSHTFDAPRGQVWAALDSDHAWSWLPFGCGVRYDEPCRRVGMEREMGTVAVPVDPAREILAVRGAASAHLLSGGRNLAPVAVVGRGLRADQHSRRLHRRLDGGDNPPFCFRIALALAPAPAAGGLRVGFPAGYAVAHRAPGRHGHIPGCGVRLSGPALFCWSRRVRHPAKSTWPQENHRKPANPASPCRWHPGRTACAPCSLR